jgi:hypothetical protein
MQVLLGPEGVIGSRISRGVCWLAAPFLVRVDWPCLSAKSSSNDEDDSFPQAALEQRRFLVVVACSLPLLGELSHPPRARLAGTLAPLALEGGGKACPPAWAAMRAATVARPAERPNGDGLVASEHVERPTRAGRRETLLTQKLSDQRQGFALGFRTSLLILHPAHLRPTLLAPATKRTTSGYTLPELWPPTSVSPHAHRLRPAMLPCCDRPSHHFPRLELALWGTALCPPCPPASDVVLRAPPAARHCDTSAPRSGHRTSKISSEKY